MRADAPGRLPAALLWDLDGTTIDSEAGWERAEFRLLDELGGPASGVRPDRQPGHSLDTTIAWIVAVSGRRDADPAALAARLTDLALEEYVSCGSMLLPGVERLLTDAAAAGVPCGLVSANYTSTLRHIVGGWPADPYAVLVGEDQVEHSKPAPDLYLHAAGLLGVDPADCVVLEDSATGAAAGRAAGCWVVGVTPAAAGPAHLLVDGLADVGWTDLVGGWREHRG